MDKRRGFINASQILLVVDINVFLFFHIFILLKLYVYNPIGTVSYNCNNSVSAGVELKKHAALSNSQSDMKSGSELLHH